MRAAEVLARLRGCCSVCYTSSESRGTFRQKARSLAPLNGWACAVKICHDGMLKDTNSLDGAHIKVAAQSFGLLGLNGNNLQIVSPFLCTLARLDEKFELSSC